MKIPSLLFGCYLGLVSLSALAGDSLAVLMYHRFGEDRYPSTNIRLAQFEAQLDLLQERGFEVVDLPWALEQLAKGAPLPDKAVAITVDDAYLSVYKEAFPRLRARGYPFTLFVTTEPVDRGTRAYMSWEQIREMAAAGVRMANHARFHNHLTRRQRGEDDGQWLQRTLGEIRYAQQRLEQEVGEVPRLFAYPYGEYNRALADRLRQQGYSAFGQQSGPVGPLSDRRALPRFPINEHYAELNGFAQKLLSLPLPVSQVTPWDPVVKTGSRPALEVQLQQPLKRWRQLSCFISGQGAQPVDWLGKDRLRFRVQAEGPLSSGRSRYNCTAPSEVSGRWYWFSQPWLVED